VAYVIRVWTPNEVRGQYLISFDFNAYGGKGYGVFSSRLLEAKRFKTGAKAMKFYRTQSKVKPYRPDGMPNRPLTASTVEILPEDEV
jgi:hypothetical protein